MKNWAPQVFGITGLLLFGVEYAMYGADEPNWWRLPAITMIPMLCYACLSMLELSAVERKRREKSNTLIGTYMLFKGLRLLLTLFAVAIYIYVGAPLRMVFVANVLVLFLVALVLTSICHLRAERKDKS